MLCTSLQYFQATDDDDISCELPTWAPDANNNFVECFRRIVDQAKLSSAIAKSFTTVKARQRSLIEKAQLVKHFNARLETWYGDLNTDLNVVFPLDTRNLPRGVRVEHLMYLHFTYHSNMAAIHSILGHPWNLDAAQSFDLDDVTVKSQIKDSDEALVVASRSIIFITRSIAVDAIAPVW